jgi:carbonic anhydrase
MMDIIERIRLLQALNFSVLPGVLPARRQALKEEILAEPMRPSPEMLYIGCVEAKLFVNTDIGIPRNGAVTHRHIAALVAGQEADGSVSHLPEAASVEFAVNVKKAKHLVVSGHTCCGGLNACLHDEASGPKTPFLGMYLKPLAPLREEALRLPTPEEQIRYLEEKSVAQSLAKLETYDCVRHAEQKLQMHGWVLDIDSKQIWEMDPQTKKFELMADKYAAMALAHIRGEQSLGAVRT